MNGDGRRIAFPLRRSGRQLTTSPTCRTGPFPPSGAWQAVGVDDEVVDDAARELLDMRATGRVVADLPPALRPATLTDAYAIQDRVVAGLVAPSSGRSIGYKVACTNDIAQAALQIDRPLYGRLLSHTTSPSGATLAADRFTHRVIEAEFAFRVADDVAPVDGGHSRATIAEHIDALLPSIEIVDHRFESWAVGALRVAADNAIHGWWVHGDAITDWQGHDLAAATVSVTRNGALVTTGSGAAVLGHPLDVMAWLADELPEFGLRLRAGDVVTTGVATDVFEAVAGDTCVADFGPFGRVTVSFV
jgi:2-keto-4-pentenoate hydratase